MQKSIGASDFSVIWKKRTESTNTDASAGSSSFPDRTVWAAEFQTSGRGQRGNLWTSSEGENLTFSILLKPDFVSAERQFLISQTACVAVVRYLASHGIGARIKWPNDIYVGDRKICGMLIEHSICGGNISSSVVGIGLNVSQTDFPPDLPNPISMALCLPHHPGWNLRDELARFLSVFFPLYDLLSDESSRERLDAEYDGLLYRKGERHSFREMTPDGKQVIGEIEGSIEGVDKATSRLVVRTSGGDVRLYAFKEIGYVI